MELDRYAEFGIILSIFGLALSLFSYYILFNVTLTALGIACIVLGLTIILTPSNPIPKSVVHLMLENSCINIEALLEELNIKDKAVFIPPKKERVRAFIPLISNPEPPATTHLLEAPDRILTEVDGKPCLMLFPPGSELVKMENLTQDSSLEGSLRAVLVDLAEVTRSIKAVRNGDLVIVELKGIRTSVDLPRFKRVFGSLPTCIAACVLTTILNAPIKLIEEKPISDGLRAVFQVSG